MKIPLLPRLGGCILIAGCVMTYAAAAWAAGPEQQGGVIRADGSSTVYPISEAVAEEFGKVNKGTRVTVGISGTGGGFKKFCAGETDISDASRPIKAAEIELCRTNGIEYVELPVAYDALTVVINPANNWAASMTVKDLQKLWAPEAQGTIMKWSDLNPAWPDKKISLYGAGVDSGTYDYFTEAIVGKEHSSRGDFTGSEDDNMLVQGVANDKYALGFFGLAYYLENSSRLRAVAIDDGNPANGDGPQLPSTETVVKGTYQPLARPLFVYVSIRALERPEVKNFMEYYVKNAGKLAGEVGYIPLQDSVYKLAALRLGHRTTGTVFTKGVSLVGMTLEQLFRHEGQAG